MPTNGSTEARKLRSRLNHPIIDADGHWLEYGPVMREEFRRIGGGAAGANPGAPPQRGPRSPPASPPQRRPPPAGPDGGLCSPLPKRVAPAPPQVPPPHFQLP